MKPALGYAAGLVLAYLAVWAVMETRAGHVLVGLGLLVWLVGGFIGAAVLVLSWLAWLFSHRE